MDMDASIVVALISSGATLVSVLASNNATRAALKQEVADLKEQVKKHNNVIERVYGLEADQAANEEKFKTLFNAVKDDKKGE